MFRLGNFTPPTAPLTAEGDLTWRQQPYGNSQWSSEKTILDSSNYRNYIDWIVDKVVMNEYIIKGDQGYDYNSSIPSNESAYNYIIFKSASSANRHDLLIQWGENNIYSNSENRPRIIFAQQYSSKPYVLVSPVYTDGICHPINVENISPSYFRICINNSGNSLPERPAKVMWLALGMA